MEKMVKKTGIQVYIIWYQSSGMYCDETGRNIEERERQKDSKIVLQNYT